MGRLSLLVLASALLATPLAQAAAPVPKQAALHFDAHASPLAGISFGLDALDHRPLVLTERTDLHLSPGLRTIAYSCPDQLVSGQISFGFEAGKRYELVCRAGRGAEIRPSDDC